MVDYVAGLPTRSGTGTGGTDKVLASDINTLDNRIDAIEAKLGVAPEGSHGTTQLRLEAFDELLTVTWESFGLALLECEDVDDLLDIVGPSGTRDGSKFLRDDGEWTAIGGGGDMVAANNLSDLTTPADARDNLGLGTAAVEDVEAFEAAGTCQPIDSDLTAIAALTTTPFGRNLLTQANGAAVLLTIGAAAGTHTHSGSDINTGTVGPARLGSGSASSGTVLRGDSTWGTPGGTPVSTKTASFTHAVPNGPELIDAAGTVVCTLPTAVGIEGQTRTVIRIDTTGNSVSVDANGSETINNSTSAWALTTTGSYVTVTSFGTRGWWVTSHG